MTPSEKIQQLVGIMPMALLGVDGPNPAALKTILQLGIGHICGATVIGRHPAKDIARNANIIQRFLKEETRLGIPAIIHNEALNGAVMPYAPVFPTAISLAATWDPEAVTEMTALIRAHLMAVGVRQALSPVMDVSRDARWGRVHETYGEDPYLCSAFAIAFTRGLQSADLAHGVLTTGKHFLGYAVTEAGQNCAASRIAPRELYEVYARPFAAAIAEAGLGSVMNSYSEIDGVPVAANAAILRDLLRGRLGFNGTVVSDYSAIQNLVTIHHAAATPVEAAGLALAAGLDVELPNPYGFGPDFHAAAAAGNVDFARLDEAVERVLADKFELGLFDDPYIPEDAIEVRADEPASAALAARLADESIVLLKNDGAVLPLAAGVKKVAVIGPHATDVDFAFPAYTYPASVNMMRAMFQGMGSNMAGTETAADMLGADAVAALAAEFGPLLMRSNDDLVREDYGSLPLAEAVQALLPDAEVTAVQTGLLDSEPTDWDAVQAAIQDAGAVILALGGRPGWFAGALTEGEGSDTANIDLPRCQDRLADLAAASGKPVAAVVFTGRPFAIAHLAETVPAIIWAGYGGQRAGQAAAAALCGRTNPGGKLPYSIPRHSGQVPIYAGQPNGTGYRRPAGDMNLGYLDMPATPLYAFGHGLSYTTFTLSALAAPAAVATTDEAFAVTATVANTGPLPGDEVVQLYLATRAHGVTRPAQELAGFKRVHLEPGEQATVEFQVPLAQLGWTGLDGRFGLEPGPLTVMAAQASDAVVGEAVVELTGPRREIAPAERRFYTAASVKE
jgi:beta-glucosidase